MLKNIKWATGALKKVPTFFRMELQYLEFQMCDGLFSLRELSGSFDVLSNGSSINVVTVTKRGPGKASSLKILQATNSNGISALVARFNESFEFKASLFYEVGGKCIPKTLRVNVNRVCRIENTNEYSFQLLGHADIPLHQVPNTRECIYEVPLQTINSKVVVGKICVKLNMFENKRDFDLDDDASISSIGSNLSFMQAESQQKTASTSRRTGGKLQEAGAPRRFARTSSTDIEAILTEMSIVKMNLDKALADKSNMEAIHKDEIQELAQLRLDNASLLSKLNHQDETITNMQQTNDMLCRTMEKLQSTLATKEKELRLMKKERHIYLKKDRIFDLKDKSSLLNELTSKEDVISTDDQESDDNALSKTSSISDRRTLFSSDEVDFLYMKSLTKASLFNDDVAVLLKEQNLRQDQTTPKGSVSTSRTSLFNDEDHDVTKSLEADVPPNPTQKKTKKLKSRTSGQSLHDSYVSFSSL